MRDVCLETSVNMAFSGGAAVWCFDLELWGVCAQGPEVGSAIAAWREAHGEAEIVERIDGDERAFAREHRPATDDELAVTLEILAERRERARRLLSLPHAVLTRDDLSRTMPTWARWRSIEATLWHICDTESRYYLPQCGQPARPRAATLEAELDASEVHVREQLTTMHRDAIVIGVEEWTATKLLRRLAWHERGELDAVDLLLASWNGPESTR